MKKYKLTFIAINLLWHTTLASVNIDSLLTVWNNPKELDTNRLHALHQIAWDGFVFIKPDSAIHYAHLQYEFAIKKGLKKYAADALNTKGVSNAILGNYNIALPIFNSCLNIREELKDEKGVSICLNNIGNIYREQGLFNKAIESYLRSLKIKENIGDKKGISNILKNIGNIYENQEHNKKALEYYEKGLLISEEINDKMGIAGYLNNIGILFQNFKEYTKALDNYEKSLKLKIEINDKKGIGSTLNNIGNIYLEKEDYKKAIEYFTQAIKIRQEVGDKKGLAITYGNLSKVYIQLKNFSKAIYFGEKSMQYSNEIASLTDLKNSAFHLFKSYKETKQYEKSLEMLELGMLYKDSLRNKDNERVMIQQEYKYLYEKQMLQDSIETAEKEKIRKLENIKKESIRQVEKKKESILRYSLIIGLLIVLFFSFFLFNRFKLTQKQKTTIEKQKSILDEAHSELQEKSKEITASINYAKRIQEAIFPSQKLLNQSLRNGFVLYQPKDIVSGDFYWMENYQGAIYFAAADCTGHGVPGAMVSVVCSNALSKSILEENKTLPGEVLDKTREIVVKRFSKNNEDVKDGMDIALCSLIYKEKNERLSGLESHAMLQFAGANNPLWIIRNHELIEIKPNKQPVGKIDNLQPFTTHTIELQKGDTIYIFTDGFADQFGGPKGKKLMYKPFKELLLSIQEKLMDEQKIVLEQFFENWKGSLEQVDDVCIIGVRI